MRFSRSMVAWAASTDTHELVCGRDGGIPTAFLGVATRRDQERNVYEMATRSMC